MDIDEAIKRFAKDFSSIPTNLVKKAFQDDPENLECLNSIEYLEENPLEYFPAMWGWMFRCNDWTDEQWIRTHITEVESCGFVIYDSDETGILLGVNGAGYDFYDSHWKSLYIARQLNWHDKIKETED
jgi:hypothetical protein